MTEPTTTLDRRAAAENATGGVSSGADIGRGSFSDRLGRWIDSTLVQRFITALILINAVTLGLETSERAMAAIGDILVVADRLILAVFVAEIVIKLIAYRGGFFRSGWNWFDFIVVGIALLPATGSLSVLRAFRILRILRLISVVPAMRRVVSALAAAIPGMFSIIAVLGLVFYVAAVLATKLFGVDPDPDMQEWFGTIGASMYTLFQIMTLESWSMGIVRPTMELYPLSWLFFVPFIVLTSFAVLNLFIGIIVDAMQSVHEADAELANRDKKAAAEERERQISEDLTALRREVASLREIMTKGR